MNELKCNIYHMYLTVTLRYLQLSFVSLLYLNCLAVGDTLGDALDAALINDPRLAAEKISVDIAKEAVVRAKSERLLELNLSGSGGYRWNETNRFDGTPLPGIDYRREETTSIEAEAKYIIYAGGRLSNKVRQTKVDYDRARSQYQMVQQDVHLQVVRIYVEVLHNQESVKIRKSNVSALVEQLSGAKTRLTLGFATKADVALADARLAGAKASLAGAQSQLEISKANYRSLIGVPAINLVELPPLPDIPTTLEEALNEAFNSAPEILSARSLVRSATFSVEIAKALTRPEVSFSLRAGLQNNFNEEIQNESTTAQIQGRIPLYQGGANNSSLRSAKLGRAQAQKSLDAVAWALQANVSEAWYRYQAAKRLVAASEAQVRASELAFQTSRIEFEAGIRSTLDLLNQEQELLESRLSRLRTINDTYVNAHQLLRSIGKLNKDNVSH